MHFLMKIVQNWSKNGLRMSKIAPSESKMVISNALWKQSEWKMRLFFGKIRWFLVKITWKWIFQFWIVNSSAHNFFVLKCSQWSLKLEVSQVKIYHFHQVPVNIGWKYWFSRNGAKIHLNMVHLTLIKDLKSKLNLA